MAYSFKMYINQLRFILTHKVDIGLFLFVFVLFFVLFVRLFV